MTGAILAGGSPRLAKGPDTGAPRTHTPTCVWLQRTQHQRACLAALCRVTGALVLPLSWLIYLGVLGIL